MADTKNSLAKQVARAQEKLTGRKTCFRCGKERDIEGGRRVLTGKTGKTVQWRCATCLNKQNPAGFTKKKVS
jgi:transposase-like protein